MARLTGNYRVPGHTDTTPAPVAEGAGAERTVSEFERRAMARLGGSIAFVMKGKNVVWTGDSAAKGRGGDHENKPQ